MHFRALFMFLSVLTLIHQFSCLDNPYKLLGVDKKASLQDIKKAYKQLAKEW